MVASLATTTHSRPEIRPTPVMILGGAIGNLWDRLLHHRVTDFLLFYHHQYEWPAFNFADSAIVVGAILLVVDLLFNQTPKVEPSS